nr:EOG090X05XL [Triops cancriformis]
MAKNSRKALMMDDESEGANFGFSVNKEYADNYNKWREKEEFQKLKDRYGDSAALLRDNDDEETSSTSESEDEVGEAWTEEMDRDFFKTLASLKKKDAKIYDPNSRFFENDEIDLTARFKKGSKKEEKPMYIRDYQRQILLEKSGQISDEEEEKPKTYVQEQHELKNSFKAAFTAANESDDDLLVKREKTQSEKNQEEAEYKAWLKGQKESIADPSAKAELEPLREFWTNPKLNKEEAFLRDFILNKRHLDSKDDNYIPTYDEIVHDSEGDLSEDEKTLEHQAEFEHKYNFRFEEPDPEFIKRYPRTIEDSLRRKDTSRKEKRDEVKERKAKEKEAMKEELKQLKIMKRRELEEKLDKLKEITGNPNLGFQENVFDEDFDPEKHDKLMQEVFNEDYYAVDEGETKPEFPDEEELEIENWDAYGGDEEGANNGGDGNQVEDENHGGPHCEDPDFNMDCDYDPNQKKSLQEEILAMTGPRKKNRRQSLFAKAVQKKKPAFDPEVHKKFENYIDEYFKLDFEDIVGDLPVRFKYRTTVANDFGLDVEEILLARDKELNKWCSVKKTCQYRNDDEEIRDQKAYSTKKNNIMLKKKILTSVFAENPEEQLAEEQEERKHKRKKRKKNFSESDSPTVSKPSEQAAAPSKKLKLETESDTKPSVAPPTVSAPVLAVPKGEEITEQKSDVAPDTKPKNKRNKKKKKKKPNAQNGTVANGTNLAPIQAPPPPPAATEVKTEKKATENVVKEAANKNGAKKAKKFGKKPLRNKEDFSMGLSDERLKAYGFNPKKFKNKLKYGKQTT